VRENGKLRNNRKSQRRERTKSEINKINGCMDG
jgi:hypothetical protein